jgi:signal peptidase II
MSMSPKLILTPEQKRAKLLSIVALAVFFVASVALDQLTKFHIHDSLMIWSHETDLREYRGQHVPLVSIGDPAPAAGHANFYLAFNLNYVRNQGAAWGALSDLPEKIRVPFFYVVTVIAVLIIVLYLRSTPLHHRLARFALVLIFSGAVGNFLDRIRLGYVIDWIDVNWNIFGWRYYFPNFNWADSAITVGIILLMIDMLILEVLRQKARKTDLPQKLEGTV